VTSGAGARGSYLSGALTVWTYLIKWSHRTCFSNAERKSQNQQEQNTFLYHFSPLSNFYSWMPRQFSLGLSSQYVSVGLKDKFFEFDSVA
jgi:hypothetical protein